MISMSVIHSIRSMRKEGCSIAAIARELHVSEPTVRKYLKAADLSPKPPVTRSRPSKIDPWVPLIEQWLAEDRESWSKQRHTATRIHERLVREHGADVSLSTVTRKVNELKGRFRLERERGPRTCRGMRARPRRISARRTCGGAAHGVACITSCSPFRIRTRPSRA